MIVVTGGTGFIGTHTVAAFRELGFECLAAGRREVDVVDVSAWERLHDVSGIVHLAASRDLRENTEGVFNALRFAQDWGVRLCVASTIGVYGGASTPFREDALLPLASPHPIPAGKKIAEIACGMSDAVVLRLPAVWGPGGRADSPFFALPRLVRAAARGETASARADDAIDLFYVKDCARAIAHVQTAERLEHRVYNVGSGRATSNVEVVDAIRATRPDARLSLEPGSTSPPAWLDVTRLRDAGFTARYSLAEGIAEYLQRA